MKEKTTETKVEAPKNETTKRAKRNHRFFLYAEGKGFIRLDDKDPTGMPNFEKGNLLFFTTRAKAIFARNFFIGVRMAESIDVLTKIA